jgi:BirA family biotin operon repressor/biotin-[acetyl-CoA-carboxylase] ligase
VNHVQPAQLPADLALALATGRERVGRFGRVRYFAEVASTNDIALALAESGEPEGTVVLAEHQRAGRGRRGRDWVSPPGAGVYASAIVRPAGPVAAVSLLTLAAGVAAARAVQAVTGLPVELKWPNDVVIGRPWRKLGGVLCETAGRGAGTDAVVVGIGLNVLSASLPRAIAERATSIEAELGRTIDRGLVLVALLEMFGGMVDALHDHDHAAIAAAWREFGRTALDGADVRWHEREVERRGRARGIDRDGALLVESGGRIERLVSGEVQWDGLSRD